jgi:hypothetical protein
MPPPSADFQLVRNTWSYLSRMFESHMVFGICSVFDAGGKLHNNGHSMVDSEGFPLPATQSSQKVTNSLSSAT